MPSAFSGLEIAKRALYAQQAALHTTGHNIANANTEGYTRQRVNMEATTPYPYPSLTNDRQAGQMGTGVIASSIERLRERFLDLQYRGEYKVVGEYEARADALEKIEVIMNEPSEKGFQYTLDEFWNSWQKLALNTNDTSTREYVMQHGKTVSETFRFIDRELKMLQSDFNDQANTRVMEMDTILHQVQDLNKQINDIVPHGYVPNDLYDKRDLLLDKLSKMVDIEVSPITITVSGRVKDTGMVSIAIKDGSPPTKLLSGTVRNSVSMMANGQLANGEDKLQLRISGSLGTPTTVNLLASGAPMGELRGLVYSRDVSIGNYMNRMDGLAEAIIKGVNTQHTKGYVSGGGVGGVFFSGTSAATMKLAITDVSQIAAASGSTFNPGNNGNALAIYKLKIDTGTPITWTKINDNGTSVSSTTNASFDGFTRQMIAALGIETQETQRLRDNAGLLLKEVDNRRQSVSGVSLDEEMSNMIKFQHAYNAAARTITAVDEMLEKIINGMGLVGR